MKTKYSIVKDFIKKQITDGIYQPDEKISSESELMEQFGVSRHTVRLAIGDLVTEGWLYREQGSGTFCSNRSKTQTESSLKKVKTIAIVTTYISDYIFPSIIRGAETYLSENGYNVSIFSTNNNHETEKRVLEKIISQGFDGVIVEPTQSAMSNPNINYYLNLESLHIPYVMIHAYYDELNPVSITMEEEKGGFIQTEHLINLGHQQIMGFFKIDDNQGIKRMKGFLNAHRKNGLSINPNYVITYNTEDKKEKPAQVLTSLLSDHKNNHPTAIVCYNDELAMQLLEVLRKEKLLIPKDISMVSYDDSFLADISEVKLTSVAHPKSEMGKKAAQTIIQLIEQKSSYNDSVKSIVFEPKIIIRDSTKQINISKTI
ncbi:MAG TPA: GntR family transcriptional regulator [Pseudogracilibacillus sp.]|nr:GntR family transcriptional regulator [Pseudogracilibacillus sp.]